MNEQLNLEKELIGLYQHLYGELREMADEKIIVLDEVSELFKAMDAIQERLDQLYKDKDNGEIT